MQLRSANVYWAYFLRFLKARMEYKADFLIGIVANIFVTFSGLLFILILLDGSVVPDISGWTKPEVLFIYGFSMISMSLFMAVAPNLYGFADRYIIQGQFDWVLLRPLNSLCQVLFESFNLESIGSLFVGLGLIGYASRQLGIHFGPAGFAWIVLSGVSGGIILISIFVFLASLSFHFEDRLGIGAPVFSLINFSRYPLPIFNKTIQFLLCWVIPFAFTSFLPATFFLNRPEYRLLCYGTPVMALLSTAVAWAAWQFGVRRYSSTGH